MRQILSSVVFLFIFCHCSGKREITTGSLLLEMIDRDRLTEYPDPYYSLRQFSSYDRNSIGPNQPGWFANADRSQFIRSEYNQGRREFVLFDADGPGAIVRFWITVALYEGNGILRFYIDHNSEPELEGEVLKMMSGDGIIKGPLATSVSELTDYRKRGHNLYFPIAYNTHCKITYESSGIDEIPGAISGEAFYYNINYRTYENETVITSFTKEDLRSYSSEIKLVQECIVNYDCRNADSLEFQRMEDRVVAPNQSVEIVISGSKAIRQILLKAEAKDINQALRSTVLEMEFDGHRTVWCPIGDFYGSGYKISPYQTRYTKVDKDGTMSCLWIMPFADTGIVRIKNYGIQDVSVDKFQIEYSGYTWNDRSMYFGAGWREDNRIATRKGGKNVGHEETDRFDVNYVELTGRGVLVGNGVTLFNTTDAWWGEGDEKIFIDGEKFPSHFGTGSEDFYGYAWSNPNNFDHPFIAQPDGRGAMQPGYVVNLRYRSLDAIPFSNSLKFDMEIWHQAGTVLNHAPVSYWYMFPSGKSNLLPVPEQAREAVALSRLDFYLDGYEERNIFIEKTLVKIEGRENGFEIRYTLDGTDPSSGSSLYEGPFQLDKSTTVKSKGYSPKGYATEILEGKFIKQKPLKGKALNSPDEGLKYQYFELNDVLNSTAELSTQSADKTGIVKSMTYPDVDLPLKFGLILTGYLHVKKTGVYSFSTITNDGSMLYVHDQLVVSNDGPHGARERSGQIALAPGYHPVRLEYIQIGGSRHLEAFIEGPGISKREILSSELAYY